MSPQNQRISARNSHPRGASPTFGAIFPLENEGFSEAAQIPHRIRLDLRVLVAMPFEFENRVLTLRQRPNSDGELSAFDCQQ
jgi:hypothetical protein